MRRALVLANKIATRSACTAFNEVTDRGVSLTTVGDNTQEISYHCITSNVKGIRQKAHPHRHIH